MYLVSLHTQLLLCCSRQCLPGGTSWLAVRYFLSENMAVQNLIIILISSRSLFSPCVGNFGGQLQTITREKELSVWSQGLENIHKAMQADMKIHFYFLEIILKLINKGDVTNFHRKVGCPSSLGLCAFFFLMIRRPPRSTRPPSSAASDVYKRQVVVFCGGGSLKVCGSRILCFYSLDPVQILKYFKLSNLCCHPYIPLSK